MGEEGEEEDAETFVLSSTTCALSLRTFLHWRLAGVSLIVVVVVWLESVSSSPDMAGERTYIPAVGGQQGWGG